MCIRDSHVLRLSDSTYGSTADAELGVAAHECGYANQDAKHYVPLTIRGALVPVAHIGAGISWPLIIMGLFIRGEMSTLFINLGILMFSLARSFPCITDKNIFSFVFCSCQTIVSFRLSHFEM